MDELSWSMAGWQRLQSFPPSLGRSNIGHLRSFASIGIWGIQFSHSALRDRPPVAICRAWLNTDGLPRGKV